MTNDGKMTDQKTNKRGEKKDDKNDGANNQGATKNAYPSISKSVPLIYGDQLTLNYKVVDAHLKKQTVLEITPFCS